MYESELSSSVGNDWGWMVGLNRYGLEECFLQWDTMREGSSGQAVLEICGQCSDSDPASERSRWKCPDPFLTHSLARFLGAFLFPNNATHPIIVKNGSPSLTPRHYASLALSWEYESGRKEPIFNPGNTDPAEREGD